MRIDERDAEQQGPAVAEVSPLTLSEPLRGTLVPKSTCHMSLRDGSGICCAPDSTRGRTRIVWKWNIHPAVGQGNDEALASAGPIADAIRRHGGAFSGGRRPA